MSFSSLSLSCKFITKLFQLETGAEDRQNLFLIMRFARPLTEAFIYKKEMVRKVLTVSMLKEIVALSHSCRTRELMY